MAKQLIEFNLNENIRVRLTELGYQRMLDNHREFWKKYPDAIKERDIDSFKKQADADGYTTFQLWCFMQEFGSVTSMSAPRYYSLDILFEVHVPDEKPRRNPIEKAARRIFLFLSFVALAFFISLIYVKEREKRHPQPEKCTCSGYTKIGYGKAVTCCGDTLRINEPDTFNKSYYQLNP